MNAFLRLLRPKQWTKNGFVLAPIFFAHLMTDAGAWRQVLLAASCFLCAACAVYIFNDMCDVEEDRKHPVKKRRPLASGEIAPLPALLTGCAFAGASILMLAGLPVQCATVIAVYAGINVFYTLFLKHIAIVDVFIISICYVLRVLMGCYALAVTVSPWIILTTFLLALFLGFGKRYHEMGVEEYAREKANLRHYNRALLDHLVTITGGAALITYAIYTAEISHQLGRVEVVYTVIFVAFGLFRYLQTIYVYQGGGEPENIVLKDKLQLANFALWLGVTLWLIS